MANVELPAAQMQALAAAVPPAVREVCATLHNAGHVAVSVGGAVRDVLLGRKPGDWDVATSALPEEVVALFRRTIPTGIAHGTVTVLLGRGAENAIEVTTFRGEGQYTDARRPDSVTFGVPLREDLARRDLVVNAIAYDPIAGAVFDPFDGIGDIARKQIRAVGDPVARFTEDGLRIVRAVRFAAVLGFTITDDTLAALQTALPSLAKIARERVCVELTKLLAAPTPSLGLRPALQFGILQSIAPEVAAGFAAPGAVDAWLAHVDACGYDARLAAWAMPVLATAGVGAIDELLRRLTFRNADRERVVALAHATAAQRSQAPELPIVRRVLGRLGRSHLPVAIDLWRCDATAHAQAWSAAATHIVAAADALLVGELALTGRDLIKELGMPPGPAIGRVLDELLAAVHNDPSVNQRASLTTLAMALRDRS
jgi:tRNA nucleotidyltransferase (CCA-adding enzyme)